MKKSLIISILFAVVLFFGLSGYYITSFLSDLNSTENNVTVGEVKVIGRAYHEKNGQLTVLNYVDLGNENIKKGVFEVNITETISDDFIENVRVYIDVYSKQNSYIRLKVYEQLTLTLTTIDTSDPLLPEIKTELAIKMDEPTDFNYVFKNSVQNQLDPEHDDWYDNRLVDGYIYYKVPVMRDINLNPTRIGLIKSYFSNLNYITQPLGYSLQIALSVEAVQMYGGPQNNWGLATPPWGGNWQ